MYGKYRHANIQATPRTEYVWIGWHDHESIRSFFSETGKGYTPAARRKLDEILEYEKIWTVFQPIVSLEDGSILGYEALSRGPEGLESPDALFSISRDFGKLRELWTFYVAIL